MPLTLLTPKEYVKFAPETPLWQALEWKKYQESLGRKHRLYGLKTASGDITATALVVADSTAFGLSVWDIPRGPLGDSEEAILKLLEGIVKEAKKEKCMAVYLSPTRQLQVAGCRFFSTSQPATCNLQPSRRHEQPEATLILDLTLNDKDLLKQMKQKGRYNIHIAQKHGIVVKESKDINTFHTLLQKTGGRQQFGTHAREHYAKFLQELPDAFLLLATHEHETIAGLLGVIWGKIGYYYYGASDYKQRALMAPYLLQWEAMQLCKTKGCIQYDLLGIAPENAKHHPWAGITRFKKQFGGSIVTYPQEQEIILRPITKIVLDVKRALWRK